MNRTNFENNPISNNGKIIPSMGKVKAQAKELKKILGIKHSLALELISRQFDYKDWNVLCAKIKALEGIK